jgi:uncharacterized protein YkwD
MISWFKKYFIPHEGNEHRPHVLRNYNVRIIVILVLFLETATFFVPTLNYVNMIGTGNMAAVLPAVLSILTNEERQTQNLPILTTNPLLTEAAELKASDMATKGYFAHTSPEGKTPWYWINQVGYDYHYAGENLAINFSDSKDVTEAWMNSPTHRENILKGKYTEIGTGVATGMYEGRETIFVAQVYASPSVPIFIPDQKTVQNSTPKKTVPIIPIAKKLPSVLGEETAVNGVPKENNQPETSTLEAKGETINPAIDATPVPTPTFIQKAIASPRDTAGKVLIIIFGIMIVALLLNIFIKIRHHHPDLITNGLVVLAIIGAILITNNYISKHKMIILESIDYVNEPM